MTDPSTPGASGTGLEDGPLHAPHPAPGAQHTRDAGWPVDDSEPVPPPPPPLRARLRGWRDRLLVRWSLLPPWAQVLMVYAASRVIDFVIIDRTARFQPPSLWNGPNPGYLGMVSLWDGDWYRQIAENGYPAHIPRDTNGLAFQNAWAFYPLFPAITRAVMDVTGMGWPLAATTVAMLCAAAAMVVIRSLIDRVAGRSLALWTVVLLCCYPAAPVLQLAYTESLGLLLLACVLWCLQRRRYLTAIPPMLLLGVTRPLALPLALVVGWHLIRRLRRRPLPGDGDAVPALTRTRLAALFALLVATLVAALEWPVIAAVVTGQRSAYTDTMAAWRVSHQVTPFQPWLNISRFVLGYWFGPVTLVVVLVALLIWVGGRRARFLGSDLRVWCLGYTGYLLAVLDPFTSLVRYLIMLFPLGTLLASASKSRAYRITLAMAFLAGQVVWVVWLWRFIPPSDWPP